MRIQAALIFLLVAIGASAEGRPIKSPPLNTRFAIRLSDPDLQPQPGIGIYDIDLFDAAESTIDALHNAGGYVICYFSAGSLEDWRPDAGRFPADVVGKVYEGWPGERWLDIRRRAALAPILEARLDLAVKKSCDAVDPDNVDGFTNQTGFDIRQDDQAAFNRWLASAAHERGLAIGLKNAPGLVDAMVGAFDFSVVESCAAEQECDAYTRFADQGKAVFQIEYRGETKNWDAVCAAARKRGFTAILADLELDGSAETCP